MFCLPMSILICFFPNNLVNRFDIVRPIMKNTYFSHCQLNLFSDGLYTFHVIRKYCPVPRQFRHRQFQFIDVEFRK